MVIQWVMSHQAVVAGLIVGLLDLVFALKPNWAANGIVHWIYLQAKKMLTPAA